MLVEVVPGDITRLEVDAVVNAANSTLVGGGGVDGAIHRAAGPKLLEECRRVRRTAYPDGLPVGEAVATGGYDLPARWVVHTVGPNRTRGQVDPALLAACFTRSLAVAAQAGATSVAFPAISAAVEAIRQADADGLTTGPAGTRVERVVLVPFGAAATAAFEAALAGA